MKSIRSANVYERGVLDSQSNDMIQLTIAIPTYDRPTDLQAALNRIGPQLNKRCILHVVDNCSQSDIGKIVSDFREKFSTVSVKYTQNQANIGASANFMRCFELCDTPWIWLLSDDDIVSDDAIETILEKTDQHADCAYINFKTAHYPDTYRPDSMLIVGFDELVSKMERFDEQVFISTNIYQTRIFKQYVNIGHHFSYSLAPMFAMLTLIMSRENTACVLSKCSIARPGPTKPPEKSWAILPLILGVYSLLDLPMKKETRSILRKKIGVMAPSVFWVALSLALHAKSNSTTFSTSIYSFMQYVDRKFGSRLLPFDRAFAKMLLLLFFIPKQQLVSIASGLKRIKRVSNVDALGSQTPFQRT